MLSINTAKILSQAKQFEALHGAYVYFLLKDNEIVYVGQSKSLNARIKTHKRVKEFDTVKYIEVPLEKQNLLELALIKCLKPKLNTQPLGALTPSEEQIIREFQFETKTLELIVKSQPSPEQGQYGIVGYFDFKGELQIGLYDDDDELEDHDEDCKMDIVIGVLEDVSDGLYEHLVEFCKCDVNAIVYKDLSGYRLIPRDELHSLDGEDFRPMREKFSEEFITYFKKLREEEDGGQENKDEPAG